MKLETFQYRLHPNKKSGSWSVDTFPDLDSDNTLVLVFCAPEFSNHPDVIEKLSKNYPKAKMIGCSSAGEIFNDTVNDLTLSVAVVKFQYTKLKIVCEDVKSNSDSLHMGEKIAKSLDAKDLKGIFILSDGLNTNGSELVNGLNKIDKKNVIVTGGLAGDGDKFKKTWTICDGKINFNQVVAVGFYGERIRLGHGSQGGWHIFGLERRVTRSKKNIVYEIDGKPALDLYKEYLGDKASELPASGLLFPLAIRKEIDDKKVVRTILKVNEKDKSLTFAGDVPEGCIAQLMQANFDRLIAGAAEAGQLAAQGYAAVNSNISPCLVIAVSCVGRRLLMGERIDEETESSLESFAKGAKQIGFYSYGEISPYDVGCCDFHNQTMTLTSISEVGE